MNMKIPMLTFSILVMLALSSRAQTPRVPASGETSVERDARMQWWREARFGMFIHWGLYSVPGGIWKGETSEHIGEWLMLDDKIPVHEYAELAAQFNPVKFDADKIVGIAKDAGMKYIVITAKHHDGFAMFHSLVSPYNIYDATPFKRDPLEELAAACRRQHLKLGFYYSESQDWHHPGGSAARNGHWDPAQDGSMDDYIRRVAVPQVRELLTRYGDVAVLWWDTPKDMTPERVAKFLPPLKLQPAIITNNRLDKDKLTGDFSTPEQKIPETGIPGKDWEACMTINHTWGYKSFDHDFKSTTMLLQNLIDIASKGGNYLLNVGPTSLGDIPQPEVERLHEMGAWLKVNGEAIYATSASPFSHLAFKGRCTQKPGKLFLHIFEWPEDGKLLVPVSNEITRACMLAAPRKALKVSSGADGQTVTLPDKATDSIASVLAVEIKGPPQVTSAGYSQSVASGGNRRTAK